MTVSRALRLLRPLLAPSRPTQKWTSSARLESSCTPSEEPPCPPCAPAPRPPCRARASTPLPARRVVCCPPPRGRRPPCDPTPPDCPLSCENRMSPVQALAVEANAEDGPECGAERDRVARRMRMQDEAHRAMYEYEVAALKAAPPAAATVAAYTLPGPEQRARATDGRTYTVLSSAPPPRCDPNAVGGPSPCPPSPSSAPTAGTSTPKPVSGVLSRAPARAHPPHQPVQLAPPTGHCVPHGGVDMCAHRPRVLLSIDRSAVKNEPATATSPKPSKTKVNAKQAGTAKGLTSRIMETLGRGRCGKSSSREATAGARRTDNKGWCASMPKIAPAPPKCREQTLTERLQRRPPGPCSGARRLHTLQTLFVCEKRPASATATSGSEVALEASKKLEAMLKEREQLQEAGRGRVVRPESAADPPALRPAGGALELSVPPGADTVCVRVSLGATAPAPPLARPASTARCGAAPPPGSSSSDSWLSIKNLQKKLSSCGRSEAPKGTVGVAGASPACGPPRAATPPTTPRNPCNPQGRVKMAHLVPNTIFVKS